MGIEKGTVQVICAIPFFVLEVFSFTRTVFAFAARQEAFTQSEVAGWLGLDHSTVHYLERRMAEALDYPTGFADYIELYNTYTSRII